MANSTEISRNSEPPTLSATATAQPEKEEKRTAEVQKSRTLTPVPTPSGSRRNGPARRRKGQPKANRTKVKAALGILTKEQRHEAGKALREKCPRISHGEVVLGQGERDIVKLIEASNKDRLQNLDPDSPWADGSVRVRLFSRHGSDTSARPKGYAKQRDNCSFLRRLSSDEFRRLRHA